MAALSGKKRRMGPSSGHDYDKIGATLYGAEFDMVNKKKELFDSDFIFLYKEDEEDDDVVLFSGDIGINKDYGSIHDSDWCNEGKTEKHILSRYFDRAETIEDIQDLLARSDIQELFFNDGDDNE